MHKAAQEAFCVDFIRDVRTLDPGIGGLKLWIMYMREFPESERIGRDRFCEIIDRYGFKLRKRKRKPKTTDSNHEYDKPSNLVRDFIPTAVNQLWVSDITYIKVWGSEDKYKFAYLALIMDAYSHEILGWDISWSLNRASAIKALRQALIGLEGMSDEIVRQLIHHSDRGIQYACDEYRLILESRGIRRSMTENGDPKENAQAERVNSTVKNELLMGLTFCSIEEARYAIEKGIEFYNTRRPHMSSDMLPPKEAAALSGQVNKRWHSYREEAIRKNKEPEIAANH